MKELTYKGKQFRFGYLQLMLPVSVFSIPTGWLSKHYSDGLILLQHLQKQQQRHNRCIPKCPVIFGALNHRVHRVATANFWRTFSDEGKISPGW